MNVTRRPLYLQDQMVNHRQEEFLPSDLIAIASCVQHSLVCLSLSSSEKGAIYHWDWYWRYPWCKDFFEGRIEQVQKRYPDFSDVLRDPCHAMYRVVVDALNCAKVVRIADSFGEWLASCKDERY
jgi:hypothetical protein